MEDYSLTDLETIVESYGGFSVVDDGSDGQKTTDDEMRALLQKAELMKSKLYNAIKNLSAALRVSSIDGTQQSSVETLIQNTLKPSRTWKIYVSQADSTNFLVSYNDTDESAMSSIMTVDFPEQTDSSSEASSVISLFEDSSTSVHDCNKLGGETYEENVNEFTNDQTWNYHSTDSIASSYAIIRPLTVRKIPSLLSDEDRSGELSENVEKNSKPISSDEVGCGKLSDDAENSDRAT